MTRPLKTWLLVSGITLVLLGACGAALYRYGSQSTFAPGVTIAGWRVGGMTYETFQSQLTQRLKQLSAFPVVLQTSYADVPTRKLPLGQLGVHYDQAMLTQSMAQWTSRSLYTRIKARWTLRNVAIPLPVSVDPDQLNATVKTSWKELYAKQPIAAKRVLKAKDQITYESEQNVLRIDTAHLQEQLLTMAPTLGTVTHAAQIGISLPIYEMSPSVTVASLRQQGITGKMAEFTTTFPLSGEGRVHNIKATATTIQDYLMAPNDTFDYAKIIAQTEAKFGYKEAPVILNGTLVPGIGGGICQVSSTLYNAVLRSGLEIVERRNHSLPVSYVPLGQDATFANGYINFKFRNNTSSYVWIRTMTTDGAVTVKLFGHPNPSITYDIDSTVVETIQPPVKYVNNPNLPPGLERPISSGKAGYKVETYRTKRENGTIVSKELISKDQYSPVPTMIAANRGDAKPQDSAPKQPIVEDGVSAFSAQ
ncbi:VanW family protein [Paenibacillus roseipurpureus]|uniref:VanW family protein n=1 Tax=Paenibacillus roseopurpureus TaxID=2918901 RepID=A0AA96LP56_9BACL|nr:VanW family protein [Paenibacillus sp. MBLB1832]WNR44716.1 VanW family protein [Paenibacillus sp. MBLB1832]